MKAESLKKYIRSIVKEEISKQLRPCLVEMLLGNKNNNTLLDNEDQLSEYTSPSTTRKQYKTYTKNKTLNDVLNETTGGIPNDGSVVGLSEGFNSVGNTNSITEIMPGESEVTKNIKENIFNRDFSSLMKAIDKKKTEKLGKLNG